MILYFDLIRDAGHGRQINCFGERGARARVGSWPSRDRSEADRARAILLTLSGWTSGRITEAFGVREDAVRLWRSDFMKGGVEALRRERRPGRLQSKRPAAWRWHKRFLVALGNTFTVPSAIQNQHWAGNPAVEPSRRFAEIDTAVASLALIIWNPL